MKNFLKVSVDKKDCWIIVQPFLQSTKVVLNYAAAPATLWLMLFRVAQLINQRLDLTRNEISLKVSVGKTRLLENCSAFLQSTKVVLDNPAALTSLWLMLFHKD